MWFQRFWQHVRLLVPAVLFPPRNPRMRKNKLGYILNTVVLRSSRALYVVSSLCSKCHHGRALGLLKHVDFADFIAKSVTCTYKLRASPLVLHALSLATWKWAGEAGTESRPTECLSTTIHCCADVHLSLHFQQHRWKVAATSTNLKACTKSVMRSMLMQELELEPSQNKDVVIHFDPSYCRDRRSRTEENQLVVAYKEHPMRVRSMISKLILRVSPLTYSYRSTWASTPRFTSPTLNLKALM